jgi:integrase
MRNSSIVTVIKKPSPDFPLFPHATGRWAKKVRGKLHYFGKTVDDPDGQDALNKWLDEREDLLAGRVPRNRDGLLSVRELINRFLTSKRQLAELGEITARSWGDYYGTCEMIIAEFGSNRAVEDLRREDFNDLRGRFANRYGPVRLGNEIQRPRTLMKWAFDSGLIDRPARTGPDFRKPAKHVLRKARAERGIQMFEAIDLRALLGKATPQLRAMIYLGLNAGLGNTDCGLLRNTNIDLKNGFLNYPRPKTGIPRRCPLWPETVKALQAAIAVRPKPIDIADVERVFITGDGLPWTADAQIKEKGGSGPRVDCVTKAFRRLLDDLGLHRPQIGFYTLRHVFETVAGESKDQVAVDCIMGHADNSIATHYRERIDDNRLKAVTDQVHKWLFGKTKWEKKGTKSRRPRRLK